MNDDLNPIGILRTKAKDPSLTSGAIATLTAAVKHLEDPDVRNYPVSCKPSVSGAGSAVEHYQDFYRPAARRRARIVSLRGGKEFIQ